MRFMLNITVNKDSKMYGHLLNKFPTDDSDSENKIYQFLREAINALKDDIQIDSENMFTVDIEYK